MVFNATVDNISVISWPLVLLVEETGVPGVANYALKIHDVTEIFLKVMLKKSKSIILSYTQNNTVRFDI